MRGSWPAPKALAVDAGAALTGGRHGAWIGAATGAFLTLVWQTVLILANRGRRR